MHDYYLTEMSVSSQTYVLLGYCVSLGFHFSCWQSSDPWVSGAKVSLPHRLLVRLLPGLQGSFIVPSVLHSFSFKNQQGLWVGIFFISNIASLWSFNFFFQTHGGYIRSRRYSSILSFNICVVECFFLKDVHVSSLGTYEYVKVHSEEGL